MDGIPVDVDPVDQPEVDDVDAELRVVHVAQRVQDLIPELAVAVLGDREAGGLLTGRLPRSAFGRFLRR